MISCHITKMKISQIENDFAIKVFLNPSHKNTRINAKYKKQLMFLAFPALRVCRTKHNLNNNRESHRLGKPGVDCHVRHEGESACAVTHIQFLVNEGALITVTADDTLHHWNFRQKSPQVVQSLKFQRER